MERDSFIIDRRGNHFRVTDVAVQPEVIESVRAIERNPMHAGGNIDLRTADNRPFIQLNRGIDRRLYSVLNTEGQVAQPRVTVGMENYLRSNLPYDTQNLPVILSPGSTPVIMDLRAVMLAEDVVTQFIPHTDHISSIHERLLVRAAESIHGQSEKKNIVPLQEQSAFLNLYLEHCAGTLVPGRENVVWGELHERYLARLKAQIDQEVQLDILRAENPRLTFNNAHFRDAGLGTERSVSVVRTAFANKVKRCVREMMPQFIQGLTLELQPKGASETVLVQFGVGTQADSEPTSAQIPDVEATVPVTIKTVNAVPFDGAQDYILRAVTQRSEMC